MLSTTSIGLAERNWNPRSRLRSSPASRASAAAGRSPARRDTAAEPPARVQVRGRGLLQVLVEPLEPSLDDCQGRRGSVPLPSRGRRGRDRCGPARAARSRRGTPRTTWTQRVGVAEGRDIHQVLGAAERPAPAISANSTVAGTCLRGLNSAVRRSRRASGTREIPTLASSGRAAPGAAPSRALVIRRKRVVLPVEGKPISPARSMVWVGVRAQGGPTRRGGRPEKLAMLSRRRGDRAFGPAWQLARPDRRSPVDCRRQTGERKTKLIAAV